MPLPVLLFRYLLSIMVLVMISESIFALFPTIPLAIAALNFRYISIAALMRELSAQIEKDSSGIWSKDVISSEINILRRRMVLIKLSSFFCGLSFLTNLIGLYQISIEALVSAHIMLTMTIISLAISMIFFCIETILSTQALNLHIGKLRG